jgi:hypothetical protein
MTLDAAETVLGFLVLIESLQQYPRKEMEMVRKNTGTKDNIHRS